MKNNFFVGFSRSFTTKIVFHFVYFTMNVGKISPQFSVQLLLSHQPKQNDKCLKKKLVLIFKTMVLLATNCHLLRIVAHNEVLPVTNCSPSPPIKNCESAPTQKISKSRRRLRTNICTRFLRPHCTNFPQATSYVNFHFVSIFICAISRLFGLENKRSVRENIRNKRTESKTSCHYVDNFSSFHLA